MKCENCNVDQADYNFLDLKCCYNCAIMEIRDNYLSDAITEYLDNNSTPIR